MRGSYTTGERKPIIPLKETDLNSWLLFRCSQSVLYKNSCFDINRWGFEEVNFVINHQEGNIIPFKKKACPNLQGTSVYFYLPFKDHILFWKNALKNQKAEVTWNIRFYETYCGWFIRLHSTWQWYVTVMTFKNNWTERDCTIKQLGKELLVLLLIWQRKPNAVV